MKNNNLIEQKNIELSKQPSSKEVIISRIIRELTDETYHCEKPRRRIIVKRGKGDKNRNADIYTVYDRCVQNIILLVVQEKLRNKVPRWCYSGIKGRSLWSNNKVDGKTIYITDYVVRQNNKDSEYFIRFQFVVLNEDGSKRLCVSNNGSYEIKEFFKLVENGAVSLPLKTKVCSDGTSFYFEQFHTSNQEACELICAELGI